MDPGGWWGFRRAPAAPLIGVSHRIEDDSTICIARAADATAAGAAAAAAAVAAAAAAEAIAAPAIAAAPVTAVAA